MRSGLVINEVQRSASLLVDAIDPAKENYPGRNIHLEIRLNHKRAGR